MARYIVGELEVVGCTGPFAIIFLGLYFTDSLLGMECGTIQPACFGYTGLLPHFKIRPISY